MSSATACVDVLIVGGGIAGLWLQHRLLHRGYSCLLVEAEALGGRQTVCSQGIVHSGVKYSLDGVWTRAASAISSMPERWRQALAGSGEVDLSRARVLSPFHYLWSTGGLGSELTRLLAGRALRGRVERCERDCPPLFAHPDFRGNLYRLHEQVLDIPSVIAALRLPGLQLRARVGDELVREGADWVHPASGLRLHARHTLLTAGEGTEALTTRLELPVPMQRRPLFMVMVKHPRDPAPPRGAGSVRNLSLYAHALGPGDDGLSGLTSLHEPILTVTTHPHSDGSPVWYLGGRLSSARVDRSEAEQIVYARSLLERLLPWIDLGRTRWGTLRIDRAEPLQATRTRPDTAFARGGPELGAFIVCWPTKLALAPDLADQVLDLLPPPSGQSSPRIAEALAPPVGIPPWEALG